MKVTHNHIHNVHTVLQSCTKCTYMYYNVHMLCTCVFSPKCNVVSHYQKAGKKKRMIWSQTIHKKNYTFALLECMLASYNFFYICTCTCILVLLIKLYCTSSENSACSIHQIIPSLIFGLSMVTLCNMSSRWSRFI